MALLISGLPKGSFSIDGIKLLFQGGKGKHQIKIYLPIKSIPAKALETDV